MELEKCGCGKPVRYYRDGKGSCNRYHTCLTYDEQEVLISKLQHDNRKYKNTLESIVDLVDGESYEYRALAKSADKEDDLEESIRRNEVYQHNIMMTARD